jgi:uncharacterized protein (TIGR02453 family)
MAFQGWSDEAIRFFDDLEVENTKAFWLAHKPIYDNEVVAPMVALLTDLAPEFGDWKLFRPYRDVRFSADKTPYKTAIAATIQGGGYVQFSAAGLGAAVGAYHFEGEQLDRFRRGVADDIAGPELERIVADLDADGCSLIAHDALKTAPRGYPKDHPRVDLLRRKGIAAWREFPPGDWLDSKKAPARLASFFRSAQPLRDWLARHATG